MSAHGGGPTEKMTIAGTSVAVLADETEASALSTPSRKYARISAALANAGPVYLKLASGAAVAEQGIPIYPGASYEINFTNMYQGPVSAISGGGQSNVIYVTRGY